MRLFVIILSASLMVVFLGFVMMNLEATVDVTLWNAQYEDVPLHLIVVLALVAGIVYAGLIGVVQGSQLWIANRRLSRQVQRLEGELNELRIGRHEPAPAPPPAASEGAPLASSAEPAASGLGFPTAPVYRGDEEEDDDIYSGDRAV